MKEKSIEKHKRIFENMYKEEPYLLLKYTTTEISKKLGLSASYTRLVTSKLQLSYKKDILKLIKEYPPYFFTYKEVLRKTKLKTTRSALNKYALKVCGIRYLHEADKEWKELQEDFECMIEDYPFPFVQLGINGMLKYLGVGNKTLKKLLKENKVKRRTELTKLFNTYPTDAYTISEIADSINLKKNRLYGIIRRNNIVVKKNSKSITKIKQEKKLYGIVDKGNRISMKHIKSFFENKIKTDGFVTIKELREQGYNKFSKYLYTIKQRYGLDVEYIYNRKKMRYERVKNG